MKQLTKLATMMIGLGLAQLSFGADWTPYLKGMQDSCDYGDKLTNILNKKTAMPKALKADVVKHTAKSGEVNLSLKNATAFGYPISKITYSGDYAGATLKVHFKTTDFTKSIGNFTVNVGNQKQKAGIKKAWAVGGYNDNGVATKFNSVTFPKKVDGYYQVQDLFSEDMGAIVLTHENGWNVIDVAEAGSDLTFDSKQKTIACSFSTP